MAYIDPANDNGVTTEEFVKIALAAVGINEKDAMDYAKSRLITEDYDRVNAEKPIKRRSAARIIHKILEIELNEKDDADWSAAERLKDLYSCHACLNHIAQVYVKGIMAEHSSCLFDLEGIVTQDEAADIAARMSDKAKRKKPERIESISCEITLDKAFRLLQDERVLLVDVRTREEYNEKHIEGAQSAPLEALAKNPHMLGDKNRTVILYCKRGYKSKIAADILKTAGFKKVYTVVMQI